MTGQRARWREVVIDDVAILVDLADPVAILRRPAAADLVVSWPDLDVGLRATSATVLRAPTGVWALYRPVEAEHPDTPPGSSAAVHIAPDGTLTRFTGIDAVRAIGTTRHGLWISRSPSAAPQDAAAWSADEELVVLSADGTRRSVVVTHQAAFAVDDGELAALIVYASAPQPVAMVGGGTRYSRDIIEIALPAGDLPPKVDAERDGLPCDDSRLREILPAIASREVVDESADPGVRWNLVSISDADRQVAIAAVHHEFAHLMDYRHSQHGSTGPLSRGMSDAKTVIAGEWPDTRVEVSFRHPHYPQGRLQRTLRVFDDAGRVLPALYASVHLMEDLATTALPPTTSATDGILQI